MIVHKPLCVSFRYLMTLNYNEVINYGKMTLSGGIDNPKLGSIVQGIVHEGVPVPEFGWQAASNYNQISPYIGVTLEFNIKHFSSK